MWIKEPPKDIKSEISSISKLNFLYNHEKFYIMDNHLAAAWCWLQKLDVENHYNFFHIDQHEDLCCKAPTESYESIKKNPHLSLDKFLALEFTEDKQKNKAFTYNNYIIQTQKLYPQWFDLCYFACPNSVSSIYLENIRNKTCHELTTNISGWVHEGKEKDSSIRIPELLNKWTLNVDIDYFFDKKEYQMFTDDYIKKICSDILVGIDDIEVITIALSPECCGGWDKAYRIAKLMAECFKLDFELAI